MIRAVGIVMTDAAFVDANTTQWTIRTALVGDEAPNNPRITEDVITNIDDAASSNTMNAALIAAIRAWALADHGFTILANNVMIFGTIIRG